MTKLYDRLGQQRNVRNKLMEDWIYEIPAIIPLRISRLLSNFSSTAIKLTIVSKTFHLKFN
jgi:hypothetical protein